MSWKCQIGKSRQVTKIFHLLLDGLESINLSSTFHLIFIMILISIIDIFGFYIILRELLPYIISNQREYMINYLDIFSNLGYSFIQLMLKVLIAFIGHNTTETAETTKALISKMLNNLEYSNHIDRFELFSGLVQFQTRNLKFSNIFFIIDWKICLKVRL